VAELRHLRHQLSDHRHHLVNRHSLFAHVRRVDRPLLFLNLLLLLVVSAIPFPTALLGDT